MVGATPAGVALERLTWRLHGLVIGAGHNHRVGVESTAEGVQGLT
jgi:hypothetical protein